MNIPLQQLGTSLSKSLQAVYLISGDEPMQKDEAIHSIRQAATEQGFTERIVMDTHKGFDWDSLLAECQSLSLFGDKRLLELNLPTAKPGVDGGKALIQYTQQLSPDVVLLINAGKLEKAQQNTKWFKALSAAGAVVQIWPIEKARLPAWVKQRMQRRGMIPTADAVQMICDRVEGNLLAADQELEKLFLLHGEGDIDAEAVSQAVTDSARYDVFQLVDTCLQGDVNQSVRILNGLRGEGLEPVLIVWALARECRSLLQISRSIAAGQAVGQAMQSNRIWPKRQACVKQALQRFSSRHWQLFLWQLSELDKQNKGLKSGNIWHELVQLVMKIAGKSLFPPSKPRQTAYPIA